MSPLEFGILGLYFVTLVILAILGTHRYIMVWLYFRNKDRRALPSPLPERLPKVTVQLPIYNEITCSTIAGLRLRHPVSAEPSRSGAGRLDRRDRGLARAVSAEPQGVDIHYLHRDDRTGLRGALDAGLAVATGSRADLRRRLRGAPGYPREDDRPVQGRSSGWSRCAGATSTELPAAIGPVGAPRRPFHPRARGRSRTGAFSTSTAPPSGGGM